jgi:predicted transcriptional regulator
LKPDDPAEDVAMAMIQDEVKQRLGKLAARMDDMRGYL